MQFLEVATGGSQPGALSKAKPWGDRVTQTHREALTACTQQQVQWQRRGTTLSCSSSCECAVSVRHGPGSERVLLRGKKSSVAHLQSLHAVESPVCSASVRSWYHCKQIQLAAWGWRRGWCQSWHEFPVPTTDPDSIL